MNDQCRQFDAGPDIFGKMWNVQFRWLQTAISIRHADTVDVKFSATPEGGEAEEKVIALPHAALLEVTKDGGHKLTDPYCMRLAAAHLRHMIETSEDMDKTIVTLSQLELAAYDRRLHEGRPPARS
jgi:hypothetical protein